MTSMNVFLLDVYELDCAEKYEICLFGITDNLKSICIRINDCPLFLHAVKNSDNDLHKFDSIKMNLFEEDSQEVDISKIKCNSLKTYYNERKRLRSDHILCNTQLSNVIQMLHKKNIRPSKYFKVIERIYVPKIKQKSLCDIEIFSFLSGIQPSFSSDIPDLLIASFDIETTTDSLSSYPVSSRKNDWIVQIGYTLRRLNSSESKRIILCLGDCDDIKDSEVIKFKTEKELLIGFGKITQQEDPDVLIGFNTFGYDYQYIFDRAKYYDIIQNIQLSRFSCMNKKDEFTIIGRINLDLLWYCRNYGDKLPQYKLSYLCDHYKLDKGKIDLPYSEIFRRYSHGGTSKEKSEVAVYCIRDCEVLHDLNQKLNAIHNLVGLSQTCYLPLNILIKRKQSAKVISLVMKECYDVKYMIPERSQKDNNGSKYQGATVLTAKKGVYRDPVAVLDFASLYPSCMIAENICLSTKVTEKTNDAKKVWFMKKIEYSNCIEWMFSLKPEKYDKLKLPFPQEELWDISRDKIWLIFQKIHEFVNTIEVKQNCYFLQNKEGIIPRILKNLLSERKKIKKKMKNAESEFMSKIYDGLQKSYKIVANSVYGQLGAKYGAIANIDVASSITSVARNLLQSTQDYVLENYKELDIVYGDTDSIFVLMKNKSMKEAIELSNKISDKFSESLPKPHLLEYEKIYYPFILFSKKRYAGLKYEQIDDKPKEDTKGIVLSRRDNCKLLKNIFHDCLKKIMSNDVPLALKVLEDKTSDLSQYDLNDFVITKRIGENYKIEPAHYSLFLKVKQRNPGSSYRVGDRISYCYVVSKLKLLKYRIETPDYIKENNIKLDYSFYIRNQLVRPIGELFGLVGSKTCTKAKRILSNSAVKHQGQKMITDFFFK